VHVNSLILFVSCLAVNHLPMYRYLSHLLAWYCVGVKVDDKSEGTVRIHPECK
jgi:hypothetical protein